MAEVTEAARAGDYVLYQVNDPKMLPDTSILCSDAERAILYSPHLAGKALQDALDVLSLQFADALGKRLAGVPREKICELVFLSGGLYYSLAEGFKNNLIN